MKKVRKEVIQGKVEIDKERKKRARKKIKGYSHKVIKVPLIMS